MKHVTECRHYIQVVLCSHRGSGYRHRALMVPYLVLFFRREEGKMHTPTTD